MHGDNGTSIENMAMQGKSMDGLICTSLLQYLAKKIATSRLGLKEQYQS